MTAPPVTRPVAQPSVLGHVSAIFPADIDAVPRARALTRECVSEHQDDLEIVTCELVTNAVFHADTAIVIVNLTFTSGGVRIEVTDQDSEHLPQQTSAVSTDTSGRGLTIVNCLCSNLCCVTGPEGKTVSAAIGDVPPAP